MVISWVLPLRVDDQKDKVRRVLKGRVPPDKDLKKEITQALRLVKLYLSSLFRDRKRVIRSDRAKDLLGSTNNLFGVLCMYHIVDE